jgi:SAM-dependent methyltransferase
MTPIIDCMQDMLVGCRTMLDVGVGTGRFALPLSERGLQIVGVDISAPMIRQARHKGLRGLVRADARRLPFRDHMFDAVLIVHLLHLVLDWIRVVHEIGRVSSRLVMAVISTPWGSPVQQDYLRLREGMGYPLRQGLNNAETELSLLVPPSDRRHAVDHTSTRNAETAIASLERGEYAISWDLPKDLHSRIIERLRSQYGQNRYSRKYVYEVATWTPEQLRNFKSAPRA